MASSWHPHGNPMDSGSWTMQRESNKDNTKRRWRLTRSDPMVTVIMDEEEVFWLEELLEEVVDHIEEEGDDL